MAKVLIVDDSALMRKYLTDILGKAGFELDIARNGQQCLDKLSTFEPDAITLDINMPVMDGLECLKQIMLERPTPVVMVSSLTTEGAQTTFKALELGAIDYVSKPSGTIRGEMAQSAHVLVEKITSAANTRARSGIAFKQRLRLQQEARHQSATPTPLPKFIMDKAGKKELIVIGVSTGGPGCLQDVLQNLPANFPVPIVIAQHMPARFTQVFAERLNKLCKMNVEEVVNQAQLKAGNIYIAKGDADVEIFKHAGQLQVKSVPSDSNFTWHPSVSKLVDSALSALNPSRLLCVQLTGMGNDGARSMQIAHGKGAYCIAEAQETAVVYGMPKELVRLNGANAVLPNFKIGQALNELVK